MNLFLGGVGTCMAFFGIFMNLYVIIVLLLNKKARTSSEWILLHLSWCGLGASFFNLCLISPSIFMARWLTSTGSLCSLVGASVLTLQLLTVWSICALSADRCAAIASPLRYTQLVTGRRVAIFFLIIWILSIGTAMAAFIVSSIKDHEIYHGNYNDHGSIRNHQHPEQQHYHHPAAVVNMTNNATNRVFSDNNNSHSVNSNSNDKRGVSTDNFYNNVNHANSIYRSSSATLLRNMPSAIPSGLTASSSTLSSHPLHFGGSTTAFRSSPGSSSSSSSASSALSPSSPSTPFRGTTNLDKQISSAYSSSFSPTGGYAGKIAKLSKFSPQSFSAFKDFLRGNGNDATMANYTSSFLASNSLEEQQSEAFTTARAAAPVTNIDGFRDGGGGDEGGGGEEAGVKATEANTVTEFRKAMGLCLPRVYYTSLPSVLWLSEWIFFILVAPLCTILICDLVVLSIARKQRHRIVMALYQITLSAQATVVRKGTTPPQLWLNRSIPARSRAVRAVFEDFFSLMLIHLPLILILVFEMLADDHHAPVLLHFLGSISLFLSPSFTAVLYGIRARSLRAAYKSYIRKRMTNNVLQHEIQQRLSPVDGGSPRPSSGAKSFRSCTPSPASSPIQTPRRLSTNDLRPPPMHFPMNSCGNSPVSPLPGPNTSTLLGDDGTSQFFLESNTSDDHGGSVIINHNHNHSSASYSKYDDGDGDSRHVRFTGDNGFLEGSNSKPRKIRSFLHLPSQHDMQEFWSGLRRPNRSPTIIITHEIRMKESSSSPFDSKSIVNSPTAEQRL